MKTHSTHSEECKQSKRSASPAIKHLAMIAGIIAPLNALPQIIKIFQTQSVEDVSLLTYVIVIATQVVWLIYAKQLGLKPLLISSIVVLLLSGTIVAQFLLYADSLLVL